MSSGAPSPRRTAVAAGCFASPGAEPTPPSLPNVRRLSLAALDALGLEELIRHGEDILVERKRKPPEPPKFGASASSLANTLGGWILLGVDDDGTIYGWEKPERLDLQSHLGSVLAAQVDPLPPFVCGMREAEGKPVGVIRVFPSADVPHIVRGTGAIYLRSSKGKEPIDDHRTLLELARRGTDAELLARKRLAELPPVGDALRPPDWQPPGVALTTEINERYIVRAAPITVTPALSEWPITQSAAEGLATLAQGLLPPPPPMNARDEQSPPTITPFARGIVAEAHCNWPFGTPDRVTVVADSGGVIGISYSRGHHGERFGVRLDPMHDEVLLPLARAMSTILTAAEACGRVAIDLWMLLPEGAQVSDARTARDLRQVQVMRSLTIPASDEEVQQLARSWYREIRRGFGIADYEPREST